MNFISLPPRRWHRWRLRECVGAAAANATSPASEFEFRPVGGRDEVDVLGVALHPTVDEGAEGVEGEAGEAAAEASALEAVLDLGVDQRQEALAGAVDEEAGKLAVHRHLEALAPGRVGDDDLRVPGHARSSAAARSASHSRSISSASSGLA